MSYDKTQIAKEFTATALGDTYHGNALYVAQDIPDMIVDDIFVIQRYLAGNQTAADAWRLQDIANRLAK